MCCSSNPTRCWSTPTQHCGRVLVKQFMVDIGVDTAKFKPHSLRGAGPTWAVSQGADPLTAMRYGGWSDFATFQLHYLRSRDTYLSRLVLGAAAVDAAPLPVVGP